MLNICFNLIETIYRHVFYYVILQQVVLTFIIIKFKYFYHIVVKWRTINQLKNTYDMCGKVLKVNKCQRDLIKFSIGNFELFVSYWSRCNFCWWLYRKGISNWVNRNEQPLLRLFSQQSKDIFKKSRRYTGIVYGFYECLHFYCAKKRSNLFLYTNEISILHKNKLTNQWLSPYPSV